MLKWRKSFELKSSQVFTFTLKVKGVDVSVAGMRRASKGCVFRGRRLKESLINNKKQRKSNENGTEKKK